MTSAWPVARWRSINSLSNDALLAVIAARRARTRMSGTHPEAVQLVAVSTEATAHLARRGRWSCTCNQQGHSHALGCEWWRNDWTCAYPNHPERITP